MLTPPPPLLGFGMSAKSLSGMNPPKAPAVPRFLWGFGDFSLCHIPNQSLLRESWTGCTRGTYIEVVPRTHTPSSAIGSSAVRDPAGAPKVQYFEGLWKPDQLQRVCSAFLRSARAVHRRFPWGPIRGIRGLPLSWAENARRMLHGNRFRHQNHCP